MIPESDDCRRPLCIGSSKFRGCMSILYFYQCCTDKTLGVVLFRARRRQECRRNTGTPPKPHGLGQKRRWDRQPSGCYFLATRYPSERNIFWERPPKNQVSFDKGTPDSIWFLSVDRGLRYVLWEYSRSLSEYFWRKHKDYPLLLVCNFMISHVACKSRARSDRLRITSC